MEEKIVKIINEMGEYLNVSQMKKLQEVLLKTFSEKEVIKENISNEDYSRKRSNQDGLASDSGRRSGAQCIDRRSQSVCP